MSPDRDERGFLARWSGRKAEARSGGRADEPAGALASTAPLAPETPDTPGAQAVPIAAPAPAAAAAAAAAPAEPGLPTLADVAALSPASDYSRFVLPGVDRTVGNAAMRKLFSDPHFNVMDGLDTYIDDYGKADPIPPSMLRRMNQALSLGLFDTDPASDDAGVAAAELSIPQGAAASGDGGESHDTLERPEAGPAAR